jgi:hypothetical protein
MKTLILLLTILSLTSAEVISLIENSAVIIKGGKNLNKLNNVNLIAKAGSLSKVTQESLTLSKIDNIQNLLELAIKENKIGFTEQFQYAKVYKSIDNGDKLLLKCLKKSTCTLVNSAKDIKNLTKANFSTVIQNAPNQIGVYVVRKDGVVKYVGRAIEQRQNQSTSGLRKRLLEHHRGASSGKKELYKYRDEVNVEIIPLSSVDEVKQMEAQLIRKYDTVRNGWNKRYED